MSTKKMTPRRGDYDGAKCSGSGKPADSISAIWTRAQCRAIEIGVGGGFIALAILAVIA